MEESFCPFWCLGFSLSAGAQQAQSRSPGDQRCQSRAKRLPGVCDKPLTSN